MGEENWFDVSDDTHTGTPAEREAEHFAGMKSSLAGLY